MKRYLLLCLLVLLPTISSQAGTIALMTSLKVSPVKIKKIEEKFQKKLSSFGHQLKVFHFAGPSDIFSVLRSPETVAVIWVSHAAGESKLAEGLNAQDTIQDFWGNNVNLFFSSIHPNIVYLGIVGCQTNEIFEKFKNSNHFDRNPNLIIHSEPKKVELFKSLGRSLKKGEEVLSNNREEEILTKEDEMIVDVYRKPGKSGWLVLGDEVLMMIPEDSTNKIYSAYFSKEKWDSLANKNIRFVENLQYSKSDMTLGLLEIRVRDDNTSRWVGFKNKKGSFIGGNNQNLYLYKDSIR